MNPCEDCIDWIIQHIEEKYCTYDNPEQMRHMFSTTDIIDKIETLVMKKLINDLEYYKHLKTRKSCPIKERK